MLALLGMKRTHVWWWLAAPCWIRDSGVPVHPWVLHLRNASAFTLPRRLPQLGPELFTQDVTPHTPLVVATPAPVGLLSGLWLRGFGSVADVGSSVLIYSDKCLWASC